MPRMVDKYTPEEEAQLAAINSKYSERIKAAYVRLSSAIGAWAKRAEGQSLEYYQALEAAMEAASAAASRLNEAMLSETGAIQEAAEERLFQSYGGDLDAMEEMIRATTPGIVATSRAFAGEPPTEEERAEEKTRAEQARQSLEEAIKTNEALMKERPDDQQLKEDTDGLKKMLEDGSYSPKPVYDMLYSSEAIKKSLLDTFSRYLDYFQEKDKARYDRVIAFFEACVAMREEYARKEEPEEKKEYRTRAKAQEAGAYSEIPASLAIPTAANYQYSMSLYQSGNAYLQPLTSTDGLKFKNGKIYFDGMQQVSEVELQNMKTKEGIENIDLALLRVFYSIILTAFEASKCKELKDVITLFVPDLAEHLGLQRNLNKQDVNRVIQKAQSFHNIVGILHGTRNGKPSQSIYPVLNFEGYDDIGTGTAHVLHGLRQKRRRNMNKFDAQKGFHIRVQAQFFYVVAQRGQIVNVESAVTQNQGGCTVAVQRGKSQGFPCRQPGGLRSRGSRYVNMNVDHAFSLRLSSTRTAFPSERSMVRGSTRRTLVLIPRNSLMVFWTDCSRLCRSRTVSEKLRPETST